MLQRGLLQSFCAIAMGYCADAIARGCCIPPVRPQAHRVPAGPPVEPEAVIDSLSLSLSISLSLSRKRGAQTAGVPDTRRAATPSDPPALPRPRDHARDSAP